MQEQDTKSLAWLFGSYGLGPEIAYCEATLADYRSLAGFEARIVDPLDRQALRGAQHTMISESKTGARAREGRVAVPAEFALRAVIDNLEFAIERAFLERMA